MKTMLWTLWVLLTIITTIITLGTCWIAAYMVVVTVEPMAVRIAIIIGATFMAADFFSIVRHPPNK